MNAGAHDCQSRSSARLTFLSGIWSTSVQVFASTEDSYKLQAVVPKILPW